MVTHACNLNNGRPKQADRESLLPSQSSEAWKLQIKRKTQSQEKRSSGIELETSFPIFYGDSVDYIQLFMLAWKDELPAPPSSTDELKSCILF